MTRTRAPARQLAAGRTRRSRIAEPLMFLVAAMWLYAAVPWAALVRPIAALPEYRAKAPGADMGGRPAWPALTMLKCVMLAKWFGLSDPQLEECLQDRLSFRRFAGLSLTDGTPDETTFVRFRARLRERGLERRLFDDSLKHLDGLGLLVKEGTLVDATIVEQARGWPSPGVGRCPMQARGSKGRS